MRKLGIALMLLVSSCGYKAPPPGKPELEGPKITIIEPHEADTVKDTACVVFKAHDPSKTARAALFVDGTSVSELKIAKPDTTVVGTLCFNSAEYYDGIRKIHVVAYDTWDNRGESGRITVYSLNGKVAEGGGRDTTKGPTPVHHR